MDNIEDNILMNHKLYHTQEQHYNIENKQKQSMSIRQKEPFD